ncbi:MAG: tyrosine-protein phosphatase [Terriglobales bacterium]
MPAHVDIHCHILPGLDDGAETMEVSLDMARMAAEDGTSHIVATPHANFQFTYDPAKIAALRQQLQQAVGARPEILIGCDFHLSYENVRDALAHPQKYAIHGTQYQLVEFAESFQIEAMEAVLGQLLQAGMIPVLTHPERNPVFQKHPGVVYRYAQLGCVVQITAGSLRGDFGKTAAKVAFNLLDRDLVHVIASDGHSTQWRLPCLSSAAAVVAEHKNRAIADALVAGNPAAIIAGRPLPFCPEPRRARKRSVLSFLRG